MEKLDFSGKKFADWEVGQDFEINRLIGKGSYGEVAEAIQKSSGKKVAIKKIYKVFDDLVDCKRILREIVLLTELNHPNIVNIVDIIEPSNYDKFNTLYVVMEFVQSDLKKLFKSSLNLEMEHVQTILYNVLKGLKYLHSADILHRDIKPANILINEDCSVRICDLGLARSISGIETSFKKLELNKIGGEENKESPIKQKEFKISVEKVIPEDKNMEEKKRKEITKFLKNTKELRRNIKRELTGHVVTRWYRAPEVILLEKEYGAAIDVWSVGCIFAELLSMIKENAPTYLDRKPLFPGGSCFPLSPDHKAKLNPQGFPHSHTDQLSVIFEVIGTPNEDESSFVTDSKAIEYLKSFAKTDKQDLSLHYPAAGKEAIDLLTKMLLFNPFMRISLNETLCHPFLTKIRNKSNEIVASKPLTVEFESEKDLTEKALRDLFKSSIQKYKERTK